MDLLSFLAPTIMDYQWILHHCCVLQVLSVELQHCFEQDRKTRQPSAKQACTLIVHCKCSVAYHYSHLFQSVPLQVLLVSPLNYPSQYHQFLQTFLLGVTGQP
uniref:Uncharacterized protein MANES_18G018300 n=1 Tax=Rhizophora mucronata TaxID=61149 RepID=A0A2P2INT8_RHIMU